MKYEQLLKDHNLKSTQISKITGISENTLSTLKNGNYKGALSLKFFLDIKREKPEIDLKKYFSEYKELIILEVEQLMP